MTVIRRIRGSIDSSMFTTKKPFKTEYAVEMTCNSCVESVKKVLTQIPGINRFDIDLNDQKVIVEGTAPPSAVSKKLKETGKKVIVRGQGTIQGQHAGAAVCIFDNYAYTPLDQGETTRLKKPQGLARLVQIDNDNCLIDVTIQGISPGYHGIHIHELGDISRGSESTGNHYNPDNVEHGNIEKGHVGDLGNIYVDENGWGDLVIESNRVKVWDVIGRSMVISHKKDDEGKGDNNQSKIDGNSGPGIIAGIIARSAGAFENTKKVCTCSGQTLWEEARIYDKLNK